MAKQQVVDLLEGGLEHGRLATHRLLPALEIASQLWQAERPWTSRLRTLTRQRRWRRLLEAHPHATPESPPMLLVAYQNGSPSGMILVVPALIRHHKALLPAHWGVDFYVPASQRARGLGEALLSSWHERSPLALGLGIADPAWPLASRLGWVRAAAVTRLSLPLDPGPSRAAGSSAAALRLMKPPSAQQTTGRALSQPALLLWQGIPPQPLLQARPGQGILHCERSDAWLDWRYPGSRRALPADFTPGWIEQRFVSATLTASCLPVKPSSALLIVLELLCRGPLSRVMRIHEVLSQGPVEQETALPAALAQLITLARAWKMARIDVRTSLPALEQVLLELGFIPQSPPSRLEDPRSGAAADRFVLNPGHSLRATEPVPVVGPAHPAALVAALQTGPWYLSLGDSGNVDQGLW